MSTTQSISWFYLKASRGCNVVASVNIDKHADVMVFRQSPPRIPDGFGTDGKAIQQMHCEGPAGEGLRLDMAQTEAGEIVDRIHLTVPTDRVDVTTLVRQVEAKFGRPTEGTPGSGSWCRARCDSVSGTDPKIWTMSAASFFSILGNRGSNARRADGAAVKAVAAREAPTAEQGAF